MDEVTIPYRRRPTMALPTDCLEQNQSGFAFFYFFELNRLVNLGRVYLLISTLPFALNLRMPNSKRVTAKYADGSEFFLFLSFHFWDILPPRSLFSLRIDFLQFKLGKGGGSGLLKPED